MNSEKLLAALAEIEKTADRREAQAKESTAAGMIESGAIQRQRAGGLREALTILESYLGKPAAAGEVADV